MPYLNTLFFRIFNLSEILKNGAQSILRFNTTAFPYSLATIDSPAATAMVSPEPPPMAKEPPPVPPTTTVPGSTIVTSPVLTVIVTVVGASEPESEGSDEFPLPVPIEGIVQVVLKSPT